MILIGWDDLPGVIVAVLLRIEHPPAVEKRIRFPSAKNTTRRRVTVGDMEAGDLVVTVVLEPVARNRTEARVKRGGGVAALGQNADRLVNRVGVVEGWS